MPSDPFSKSGPPLVWSNHTPENSWDWFFQVVLAALLIFLPFSLGAVEAWSELVVVCAVSLLAIGLALRAWFDLSFRLVRSWSYLPLFVVLCLIVLQLIPLPSSLVGLISSQNIELRQEFLGDQSLRTDDFVTFTLYSHETSHDLRLALVFAVLFFVTANVFRSSIQIKRVLLGLFVLGCAESGVALLQILTLSTRIHWTMAERGQVVTSGSFINYSHFCQFVNLTIGAGIALLLIRMKEDRRRGRDSANQLAELQNGPYLRLLTGIVLCTVAVFTSMSRNGAISLLLAAGGIGILLYRRGVLSVRGWLIGMVPWSVALVIFLTCFDTVYDRFATLDDNQHLEGRLELTAGVLRAWRDFPLIGTGLGTHEYVFPLYDTSVTTSMAEHADNDWAQLLEEFGLVGTAAVSTFVVSIFWIAGRLMFAGKTSLSMASFGLCVGLFATAWHSLSDFGQHLPGIFCLTAVISGLIVAISHYDTQKAAKKSSAKPAPQFHRYRIVLATVGVLFMSWWAISGAITAHRGEAWNNVALAIHQELRELDWQGSDNDYVDLLTVSENASDAEPGNVKSGHLLNLARWRSISRVRDPESGRILLAPEALPFVEQIVRALTQLRTICPVYGPLYGLEGELRLLVLDDPQGTQLINQAARLTPFDPDSCFLAGQLAAREGRSEDAEQYLNRAVALDPALFKAVARVYLDQLASPERAEKLAGDSYRRLNQLALLVEQSVATKTKHPRLINKLKNRALECLRNLVETDQATAVDIAELAAVAIRNNEPESAIPLYRRALTQQYGQVTWRLALARALRDTGENKQALREARICLRIRPEMPAATRLIQELNMLPRGSENEQSPVQSPGTN